MNHSFAEKMRGIILLMRPHHWIKNGFVLVPVFFGGIASQLGSVQDAFAAALVFCLASSAIYVFNDLRDIEADRLHIKKRKRPLASGVLSPLEAVLVLCVLLLLAGALLYVLQPQPEFLAILALYMGLNLGYSLGLKQVALLEMFIVSVGYILRLIAGGMIVHEHLTNWIIACTGLMSLLLTVGKRRGDLVQNNDEQHTRKSLKSYSIPYLDLVMTMLAAATIVTYLQFTMSDYAQARFGEHVMLSAVFVVLGIMRYMQVVVVESGGDQPTTLLYRDRWMIGTVAACLLYFILTIYIFRA